MYVEALNADHEELFAPALHDLLGHGQGSPMTPEAPTHDDALSGVTEEGLKDSGARTHRPNFRWM